MRFGRNIRSKKTVVNCEKCYLKKNYQAVLFVAELINLQLRQVFKPIIVKYLVIAIAI